MNPKPHPLVKSLGCCAGVAPQDAPTALSDFFQTHGEQSTARSLTAYFGGGRHPSQPPHVISGPEGFMFRDTYGRDPHDISLHACSKMRALGGVISRVHKVFSALVRAQHTLAHGSHLARFDALYCETPVWHTHPLVKTYLHHHIASYDEETQAYNATRPPKTRRIEMESDPVKAHIEDQCDILVILGGNATVAEPVLFGVHTLVCKMLVLKIV